MADTTTTVTETAAPPAEAAPSEFTPKEPRLVHRTAKSLTGQTVVDVLVEPNGSTLVTVSRYGKALLRQSWQEEQELPRSMNFFLSEEGNEVVVMDGDREHDRLAVV